MQQSDDIKSNDGNTWCTDLITKKQTKNIPIKNENKQNIKIKNLRKRFGFLTELQVEICIGIDLILNI